MATSGLTTCTPTVSSYSTPPPRGPEERGDTPEEIDELEALRAQAAERESIDALRARILAAVRRADEATLRAIAALLEA